MRATNGGRLRHPMRRVIALLGALLALIPGALAQEGGGDHLWTPPRAEAIRRLAEAIVESRRAGNEAATRDGVLALARALLDGVPDGAFPLSPDRWVGPSLYLQEEMRGLAPESAREVVTAIDFELGARIRQSGAPPPAAGANADQIIPERIAHRIARDFPDSRLAASARERQESAWLEQGHLEAYLDRLDLDASAGNEAEIAQRLAPSAQAGGADLPFARQPLSPTIQIEWGSSMYGGNAASPWFPFGVEMRCAGAGSSLYVQGNDELSCFDGDAGTEVWKTPFLWDPPAPIPRTLAAPVIHGSLVVATFADGIIACDRANGALRWHLPLHELFPPAPEEAATANSPPAKTAILSVTPPLSTPRGIALAVLRLERSSLVARLLLLDESGAPIWNRPAGSAQGATYLGLGAARVSLAARGDELYFLTQRGFLSAHHFADGALLWSTSYPALARGASQDALRFDETQQAPALHCTARYLIAAPVDSNEIIVWNRADGALLAAIPRGAASWWGRAARRDEEVFLLASARSLELWSLQGGRPRSGAAFALDASQPPITGAPIEAGPFRWFIPCAAGFYELDTSIARLYLRPLDLTGATTGIETAAGLLIAHSAAESIAYAVRAAPPEGSDKVAHLRYQVAAALARGDMETLAAALAALAEGAEPAGVERAEESALARQVLALAATEDEAARAAAAPALFESALALLPANAERARQAWDVALRAARRGDFKLARAMASTALVAAPDATVEVLPDFVVPVELAARRLLTEISVQAEDPAADTEREARAQASLASARLGGTSSGLADVVLRFPYTASARRAALDLASRHYRDGLRRQSLLVLRRLTLFEPDTPEAVEARFRMAELHREEGRFAAARGILEELIDRYGALELSTPLGKENVAARGGRMLAETPPIGPTGDPPLEDDSRLVPAWRSPIDLSHQRDLQVHRFPATLPAEFASRFLIVARHNLEQWDAATGERLWSRQFRRGGGSLDEFVPAFADRAALRGPLLISADAIVLHDGTEFYCVDPANGALRWRLELPPSPEFSEKHIVYIERAVAADGVLVALSADRRLCAYRIDDAALLWQETLAGDLAGDPAIAGGRVLFATRDPAAAEIRNLATGQRVRTLALERKSGGFVHEPWFGGAYLAALPIVADSGDGMLRVVDVNSGVVQWEQEFAAPLVRVHILPGVPFWIAELDRQAQQPALLGIAPRDGRILWTKTLPPGPDRSAEPRLHAIEYYGGQLHLLEGEFAERKLTCLQVSPSLLEAEIPDDHAPFELKSKYSKRLSRGPDHAQIDFYRDWILVRDSYRCDLTVIERESGEIQRSAMFRAAKEFLAGRRRLYYAGFIADTLVVFTMRGGMGLRPLSSFELLEGNWHALDGVVLLDPPDLQVVPPAAVVPAFRAGGVERACRILETLVESPALPRGEWQSLYARLAGLAQQRGEEAPLRWQVPHLTRIPEIDGGLDELWNAAFAIPVHAPRYFHIMQGHGGDDAMWHGRHDLSALVLTAWSDEGFHIAIDVTDDTVVPYDKNARRWTGDCFLLAFDFQDDGGQQPDSNDQLLTLALTVPKPPPAPAPGADGENPPPAEEEEEPSPPGRYQVQRKGDGSGIIYEVTIFWDSFREARADLNETLPRPGMTFRMNILLTDDDTGRGAAKYCSISAGQHLRIETRDIWDLFIPEYFPRLRLGR